MVAYIIDRRENSRNKSAVNRQRFLDRYKKHIQKAVSDAIDARSITDVERGEEVIITADDISEPVFQHGTGGRRSIVHPGNKEFIAGDRIPRPSGGAGAGGSEASDSGEGDDDFVFQLTQDEFLEFLFDDLELPNLTKRHLKGSSSFKYENAGYTNDGVPAKLSVLRSLKQSKARRIALCGQSRRSLAAAMLKLEEAEAEGDELGTLRLTDEIERLQARIERVPFLDTQICVTRCM